MDRVLCKIEKDKESGCWNWLGYKNSQGYGNIYSKTGTKKTHRFVYEELVGEIPDNMYVCHTCDNPSCVNPEHLFLGTPTDNNHDMLAKGRRVKNEGVANGRAKLTPERAIELRQLHAKGNVTYKELGSLFGISDVQAANIVKNKYWK